MNKIFALALVLVTARTQAAPTASDLHPTEASLVKQLQKYRKDDSRCNNAYTDKLQKADGAPGNGEEYQNAKDAHAVLKILKGGHSPDAKTVNEIVSTLTNKSQDLRGEKVMGELFSAIGCKVFAEYNALRRLMLNSKLGKKGFPSAKDLKPQLFNYLQRGSELDSLMTLLQIALVRTATESGVVKVSDDLLKSFATLSNTVGTAKKKNDALAKEIWEKGQVKDATKPDEKELSPEEQQKLLGFGIQSIRDLQPIRKEYAALVSKLKSQNP